MVITLWITLFFQYGRRRTVYVEAQGPSLLKNFAGDKPLWFAFLGRHHVHSTVERPFCKIGEMGVNNGNYII